MERTIINELRKWKNSKRRKPLILKGARQVGKTWILKEFGKEFKDGYVYINFDKDVEYHQFFKNTKDVKRIITNLMVVIGKKITEDTLLIFDEIQACPNALNALKYFCEDEPKYYVACAGSLPGLSLSEGFPVGKVNFLNMRPMSFKEFLLANDDKNLIAFMANIDNIEKVPDAILNPLIERLKMYYLIGGMPEAVRTWIENKDIKEVDEVLLDILDSYESDFGKRAPIKDVPKIRLIWRSLPSQLSRDNKKFLYSAVKNGARAREYENALNWLINADLVKHISKVTKPYLPLSSYEDLTSFKIYMNDVGLLRRHSRLSSSVFIEEEKLFVEFKGALTENFVLESLLQYQEDNLYYWTDEADHEVDFVIQKENDVFPIEVKAGKNIIGASLKKYLNKYNQTKFAIRFSLRNLSFDGKILNVPLCLIDELDKIISLATKNNWKCYSLTFKV